MRLTIETKKHIFTFPGTPAVAENPFHVGQIVWLQGAAGSGPFDVATVCVVEDAGEYIATDIPAYSNQKLRLHSVLGTFYARAAQCTPVGRNADRIWAEACAAQAALA
jgi:hypothetical protein